MTSLNNGRFEAYIQTALWSSTTDNDAPMDDEYSINDLDDLTRIVLNRELEQFFNLLELVTVDSDRTLYDAITEFTDDEYIAHDFWLTRNGHGAGFWDGDYEAYGEKLTAIADTFGECDLYVGDDGKLHV